MQLETAARAGQAPADVSMMSQVSLLRGMNGGLWATLDESAIPNLENVRPPLQNRDDEGQPRRRRRGLLVHHARDQHRDLPRRADLLGSALEPANQNQLGL